MLSGSMIVIFLLFALSIKYEWNEYLHLLRITKWAITLVFIEVKWHDCLVVLVKMTF